MKLYRVDEFDDEFVSEMLSEIYGRATEWLWFSTSLHPSFFNRDSIQEQIIHLAESGVNIRVLLDSGVDVSERRGQVPWIFDHENIQIRQSNTDISHRVISDHSDLRLEKEHEVGEMGASNLIAIDAVDDLANPYKTEFEGWWDSADSVS